MQRLKEAVVHLRNAMKLYLAISGDFDATTQYVLSKVIDVIDSVASEDSTQAMADLNVMIKIIYTRIIDAMNVSMPNDPILDTKLTNHDWPGLHAEITKRAFK